MSRVATRELSWNPAILAFIGLSALDVLSTWVAIQAGMGEGNPLAGAIIERAGLGGVFLYKLILVYVVTACLVYLTPAYPRLRHVLKFANVFMALVVILNTVQILLIG